MNISIYTLTSPLHDEAAVAAATETFLQSVDLADCRVTNDYTDYGVADVNLIFVRTGGTEGVFKQLLPQLRQQSTEPFYLLTSGQSNSLAASMEILSYLNKQGIAGEIIHGSAVYVKRRVARLSSVAEARRRLKGQRLGIIGKPSDWLIASDCDADAVARRLGIELVEIEMDELLKRFASADSGADWQIDFGEIAEEKKEKVSDALPDALRLYKALRTLVDDYRLSGFTIRCFDLLTAVHNTGCLALARLNSEGIVAGCEGDVPTMLTMAVAQALAGMTGFQANPSAVNPQTGEITFAHCTIPLNMVTQCTLDTHFESGIGVGIHGEMREGPVTILKVAGDLRDHFCADAELLRNQYKPDLCRTQIVVKLNDPQAARYFLTRPIGNHHVVVPGHIKSLLTDFLAAL